MEADLFIGTAGQFLGGNFPKIDAWDKVAGIATSFKTLDTSLKSYNTSKKFAGKIKKYIEDIESFKSATKKVVDSAPGTPPLRIRRGDVKSRVLKVGIPSDLPSDYLDEFKLLDNFIEKDGKYFVNNVEVIFKVIYEWKIRLNLFLISIALVMF